MLLSILSDLAVVDEPQLSQHKVGFTWVAHIDVRLKKYVMYVCRYDKWVATRYVDACIMCEYGK